MAEKAVLSDASPLIGLELGIAVSGTAGILLVAKRRGPVSALRPFLVTLAATPDFRLSADVVRAVLAEAGED